MIKLVKGDLLDTDCQYICHQVNCQGVMNSGVAKAIREKWPVVYTQYLEYYRDVDGYADDMLGEIQRIPINDNQCVINMFAQENYGYDGRRYTSYDAFWSCINRIAVTTPKGSSIAFPDHIGCVRGGANWDLIERMIEVVLGKDYDVYFYRLED